MHMCISTLFTLENLIISRYCCCPVLHRLMIFNASAIYTFSAEYLCLFAYVCVSVKLRDAGYNWCGIMNISFEI